MSTRTEAVLPLHWVKTAPRTVEVKYEPKIGTHEVWAGAVYLMVWSVLWLAVIVTVLSPLDGLFGGAK